MPKDWSEIHHCEKGDGRRGRWRSRDGQGHRRAGGGTAAAAAPPGSAAQGAAACRGRRSAPGPHALGTGAQAKDVKAKDLNTEVIVIED